METGIFIRKIPVSFCKIGKFVLRGARIATRFLETSPRHIILKNVTGDLVMKEENPDKMITYRDISRIPMEMRHDFENALKRGIYKELHRRKMLSDRQLSILLKNR